MSTNMDKKQHYMKLHDIKFKDPDIKPNRQLAFSIPLFESHFYSGRDERYFNLFNDVFTKGAMWSAMSFIWNSDLGENGVKFYFHIESNVYDLVYEYLYDNGVPDEYIRKIDLPEEYKYNDDVKHTQFGKKFMCFYDDLDVHAWNIIGSDIFLCSSNKVGMYRDLTSPFVRNNISVHEFKLVRYNYCFYMQRIFYAAGLTMNDLANTGWVNDQSDIWKSENMIKPNRIENLCFSRYDLEYKINEDVPSSDYVVRPFLGISLLQIPNNDDFISFFKKYGHKCYHDEGLLSMYFLANNIIPIRLDEVLDIPCFIWENAFNPKVNTYLAHYIDDEQTPGSECYVDFYLSMLRMYNRVYDK